MNQSAAGILRRLTRLLQDDARIAALAATDDAQAVIAALRQRGAAQSATAKGYGETQPVAPNEVAGKDNPGGRQLNRRVEIFVRT